MHTALAHNHIAMETLNPLQVTIMAYDGVIQDLRQAKTHWLNQSQDHAIERNQHAQDLITELLLGLDYEQGGEIARNLSRLYDFALRQLVSMGPGSDAVTYDQLITIFDCLKEAWVQIDNENN